MITRADRIFAYLCSTHAGYQIFSGIVHGTWVSFLLAALSLTSAWALLGMRRPKRPALPDPALRCTTVCRSCSDEGFLGFILAVPFDNEAQQKAWIAEHFGEGSSCGIYANFRGWPDPGPLRETLRELDRDWSCTCRYEPRRGFPNGVRHALERCPVHRPRT